MGAWKQLDTTIEAKFDLTDLDRIIGMNDPYGIYEPFKQIAKQLKKQFQKGAKKGVEEIAKRNISFQEKWINKNCKNPSGMLASSIGKTGSDYSITTGTRINDVYPMSIEYGHKEIYPVKAKALAFYDDSGELIFRKKVRATKPRPFVAPAYDDTDKIAEKIMMLEIAHAGTDYDGIGGAFLDVSK